MTSSSFARALLTLTLLFAPPLLAEGEDSHGQDSHGHHTAPETADPTRTVDVGEMSIPDVTLLDQDGEEVHFYTDLVEDRVVVVNFVFTTCTTICPPMGANFAKLQRLLGDRAGSEVEMISISVDPAVDTPGRLREWGDRFGRQEGWTLVTGAKPDVDRLLKALEVFTPDKDDHSPIVLLGDDAQGRWTRAYGLAPPAQLAGMVDELLGEAVAAPAATGDASPHEYFPDTVLVDQDGERLRFYSDLMHDRVVVIAAMFTTCEGVCPVTMANFKKIQEWLGPRLGEEVVLLAVTVDPETDDPERLGEYARQFGAREGWHFLTGDRADVERVLMKLGLHAEYKESHSPVFLVGNDRTGLWKKAMGLAGGEVLIEVVASVLEDQGPTDPPDASAEAAGR